MSMLFRRLTAVAAGILLAATGAPPAHAATQPWMDTTQTPEQRAAELLAAMTLAEKLTMMHGGASCGYAGCVDANSRLGIPAINLLDGPAGGADGITGVTSMPAPVSAAATWDTGLMRQYGATIGAEEWG